MSHVSIQGFIRNRFVRIALALSLIVLSGWAFLPYLSYRIAPSAFVNAALVRVSAPIAGRLSQKLPPKGDFIDRTTSVTLIESLSTDRRHLFDLDRQHATAKERAELARTQLKEIRAVDDMLAKRMDAYRAGMIKRISYEIDEAQAERTGCLAEAHQRRDIGSRMEQLAKSGTTSQIRTAEALALQEAITTKCGMAEARLLRLKTELESARDGVVLRDGANDVPYSQQQRDRLVLRRQELETEELQESSRAVQFAMQIEEERNRLKRVGQFDLSLPKDHVVWSVAASPGSTVTEGQTILDLADCDHRFVAVDLPEREFEKTKPGDPANVRLIGSDEWLHGVVRQVRGSAARADDRLLAAQVAAPGPGSITVEVALTQDASPAGRNSFCNIGRLAEVRFQRGGFAVIEYLNKSLSWSLQWLAGRSDRAPVTGTVGSK